MAGAAGVDGDVWLNTKPARNDQLAESGWHDYIHEVGHALGLHHPNDNGNASDQLHTVMSYKAAPGALDLFTGATYYPVTPMVLDIAAIQSLYGANLETRKTGTTYFGTAVKDTEQAFAMNDGGTSAASNGNPLIMTIWDASGKDTISAANQSKGAVIDLTPGSFSKIGADFFNIGVAQLWTSGNTAYGYIENAIGSKVDDTIQGNLLGNDLDGGAGADTLAGQDSSDTYHVDNPGDVVVEDFAEGSEDHVFAKVNGFTLPANVENLTLEEGQFVSGNGNELDNDITGNSIANTLNGGAGMDFIDGRGGIDTLTGGPNGDTFIMRPGEGNDTITDFEPGDTNPAPTSAAALGEGDVIDLSAFNSFNSFASVQSAASQVGSNTVINLGNGQTLTLQNVNRNLLTEASFKLRTGGGGGDDFAGDPGTAGAVGLGGTVLGNLEVKGDLDWFKVQLTAGPVYTVDVKGALTNSGTLDDPYLYIFNAAGTLLGEDDDGGTANNSQFVFTINQSGTYFLGVGAYADAYTGTYALSFAEGNPLGVDRFGTSGPDNLGGTDKNDMISGQAGNDFMTGGGGNDDLFGGSGVDTAAFGGARGSYSVRFLPDLSFLITDLRGGSPDGTDVAYDVESFQFGGRTLTSAQLFQSATLSVEQLITRLYIGYFNRAPDVPGMKHWVQNYNNYTLDQIAGFFAHPSQTETVGLYPFLANPKAANYANVLEFVTDAYWNLFGRVVDGTDQGVRYWATSIAKHLGIGVPVFGDPVVDKSVPFAPSNALIFLINGAQGNDALTIAHKMTVGVYYEGQVEDGNIGFSIAGARAALSDVTFNPQTVYDAIELIDATAGVANTAEASLDVVADSGEIVFLQPEAVAEVANDAQLVTDTAAVIDGDALVVTDTAAVIDALAQIVPEVVAESDDPDGPGPTVASPVCDTDASDVRVLGIADIPGGDHPADFEYARQGVL